MADVRRTVGSLVVLAALAAPQAYAQAPLSVRLRVVDASTETAVAAAIVDLLGVARRISDASGEALFGELRPGRYAVVVQAFGYESYDGNIVLHADTVVTVRLRTDPLRLDTLTAELRRITVRGEVRGRDTDLVIPHAVIRSGTLNARADGTGFFRLRRITAGVPFVLRTEAEGYLPSTLPLLANRDTTVNLVLEPDPVGQRMVRQQVMRLEQRANAFPQSSIRVLDRADLLRHGSASLAHALRLNNVPTAPGCLIVDDRRQTGGVRFLETFMAEEIERVEVLSRIGQVRVYTYAYVRQRLPRQRQLPPISDRCF